MFLWLAWTSLPSGSHQLQKAENPEQLNPNPKLPTLKPERVASLQALTLKLSQLLNDHGRGSKVRSIALSQTSGYYSSKAFLNPEPTKAQSKNVLSSRDLLFHSLVSSIGPAISN